MLFKNDIKLLNTIKNQPSKLPNGYYDWNDIYPICGLSETEYLISLRNLNQNDCISFGDKSNTAFRLEANGKYFKEFRRQCVKQYVMDKLIDFLAVIISIIALIISVA